MNLSAPLLVLGQGEQVFNPKARANEADEDDEIQRGKDKEKVSSFQEIAKQGD